MTRSAPECPARRRLLRTTAAVGLLGSLAGCGDGDGPSSPTGTPEPSLDIGRVQFVADQPSDYREYEPVPDKTYQLGGEVWVYFEPDGVARESAGEGTDRIDLQVQGEFRDGNGESVNTVEKPTETEFDAGRSLDTLYLWVGSRIPEDATPGTWSVELGVSDRISGESTSETREFEVEGGGQASYLETFQSSIRSETDVELTGLGMEGGEVLLEFHSQYETRSNDWHREVGFIAGLYAGLVGRGWQSQRLSAATVGSGGETVTWQVRQETALAFANGDIGNQEFYQRVVDTMESQ